VKDKYPAVDYVTLTATPSAGYDFDSWSGQTEGIAELHQNPVTFLMGDRTDNNRVMTANFIQSDLRYTVIAACEPSGGGSVMLSPEQPLDGYLLNQSVSVLATAQTGYVFSQWSGDLVGSENPQTFLVSSNKTITAVFVPLQLAVITNTASSVTTTSARLNGDLISLGTASSVAVSFEWGTSPGPYPTGTTGEAMTSVGTFYFDLGSLTPSTTYYYQAKAVGDGTSYGTEKSFTTASTTTAPLVTTSDASSTATASARLNGNLTSMGTASSVTMSFVWGTSSGSYPNETNSEAMTSTGTFHLDLASLAPGTTYYFEAKGVGDGTSFGAEKSFTTGTTPPAVTTNDASGVTTTSATLNGDLTSMGTAASVTVSFQCGTTFGGPYNMIGEIGKDGIGTFSVVMEGLTPGTTYYYRVGADGDGDPVYSAEKSFTTGQSPEVETLDPVEGKGKQHLTVTITGENLNGATGVSFGSGITVKDFNVNSSTEITAEIAIDAKAAKGTRDVSVTTAWGTVTKTDGFSVVGGGGGVCSGGALVTPGAPSEMTTTLVALGLLLGLGYLFTRRGARNSVRA